MCGISALFQKESDANIHSFFNAHISNLMSRGPDTTKSIRLQGREADYLLGFTRLSINDVSDEGMQPMTDDENTIYLICNGEIYNHKTLKQTYNLICRSQSDCEVIWRLYQVFDADISKVIQALDGEFAFVLVDTVKNKVFAYRDRYGVRPLYICSDEDDIYESSTLGFVSQLKGLCFMNHGEQAIPGAIYELDLDTFTLNTTPIYDLNDRLYENTDNTRDINYYTEKIRYALTQAVEKRVDNSDRQVCCLLSGGLDSSLVAALASQYMKKNNFLEPLETFSIGLKGSPDLYYAKMVAQHIQSKHHSIELTEADFLGAIEETIRIIESYDTTSVRASVGNLLVAKYIKKYTNNKVVLCGDYSDEVTGGYKYFSKAPNECEFDIECRRLVSQIHFFDSLRADRTISSQGLEVRVPFSDALFIESYLSVPPTLRIPTSSRIEKFLLRKAFDPISTIDHSKQSLLPKEVLWRSKEAFSDGVTDEKRSWYLIIQEHVDSIITNTEFETESKKCDHNKPILKETYFYRKIFNQYYHNFNNVVPYYWMPRWCGKQSDPSARLLTN